MTIDKSEISDYGFKDKTSEIFKGTEVKFHNPNSNKLISSTRTGVFLNQEKNYTEQLDILEIREKAETEEQANIKAEAYIYKKVSLQQTGNFTAPGNVLLISGNNIDLTGMGAFSGIWHILTSTHTIDVVGGYVTSVEIKRINITSNPDKLLPKNNTSKQTYQVN